MVHEFPDCREMVYETDVLIVGGGSAAMFAAIAAAEEGCTATIVEKGASISSSGNIGSGIDHLQAILNEEPWDTAEEFLGNLVNANEGLIDLEVAAVFVDGIKDIVARLEKMGVPLRDPATGKYRRVAGLGSKHPTVINFAGGEIKPILARAVRSSPSVKIIEETMLLSLLVNDKRVIGGVGFNIKEGSLVVVMAKAVIIASGGVVRHFPVTSGPPFRTHHYPYNTGDGLVMAYLAGAELANMEFAYCSVVPKGFSAPGITGFVGLGAKLINSAGEQYMHKYHPLGENAPRNYIVWGTWKELEAGRGPCYLDCTHLTPEAIRHVEVGIQNEKPLLLEYLKAKGIDVSKQWLEIELQELDQGVTFAVGAGNGLVIDADCATNLEGLYACGDAAYISFAAAGAFVYGFKAGTTAVRYAKKLANVEPVDREQLAAIKSSIYQPLARPDGYTHQEIQERLQAIMARHAGLVRTAEGLKEAVRLLKALKADAEKMKAANYHELMRVQEMSNLIQVSELLVHAALFREESRMVPAHYRSDFPARDDARWLGYVIASYFGGEPSVVFRKI